MRSFFIFLSKARWARNLVMHWSVAWKVASRFISGEKLEDAVRVIRSLNGKGINASLDHLGEDTDAPESALRATQAILDCFDAIDAAGVRANVSLKLSQLGLGISRELCIENMRRIMTRAKASNNFLRIDMEDHTLVDATLEIFHLLRSEFGPQYVGIVIQSYLYRSEADLQQILARDGKVRLCKGAYDEPAQVAYPVKANVDANFDRLARQLMDCELAAGQPGGTADGRLPPITAIASHDEVRIQNAKAYAASIGLAKNAIEFQMLYGIRRELQEKLAQEGYPVRVYVPYGTEWYPYFMRRLAERPANVWFVLGNFFRK
ncbi:MAG TPA: proline dehydrogenase family protein [Anaerolineales bacterium]|nr:proline dehydrogenase family protein [Anaerolineales bacterium]